MVTMVGDMAVGVMADIMAVMAVMADTVMDTVMEMDTGTDMDTGTEMDTGTAGRTMDTAVMDTTMMTGGGKLPTNN